MSYNQKFAVVRWSGLENELVSMVRLPEVLKRGRAAPWAVFENLGEEDAIRLLGILPEYPSEIVQKAIDQANGLVYDIKTGKKV